jgi:hypothetical protein
MGGTMRTTRHGTFYIMHKDWNGFIAICREQGYSFKTRSDKWNIADLAMIVSMTTADYLSVSRQLKEQR